MACFYGSLSTVHENCGKDVVKISTLRKAVAEIERDKGNCLLKEGLAIKLGWRWLHFWMVGLDKNLGT